ncbi:MAG TPA: MFS transporter [Myxococcota bacterium]|nr:MFS transporter [Myxococcota bacterium]
MLALLLLVFAVSSIDRQVLTILIQPIKADLGASDAQLGLLVGFGFTLFYTLLGLPIARWADRGTRRTIIALALAVWSGMTALSGLAGSYAQLLLARVGVGAGEAGCVPASHSLLSDHFPAERRGRAFSIYALGVPIGTLCGLLLGGVLAEALGWRAVFLVLGLPGLLLAVVVRLALREPPRGQSDAAHGQAAPPPLGALLDYLRRRTALRYVLLGAALNALVYAGIANWAPTHLMRVHGMAPGEVGLALGLLIGLAGGAGTFAGGPLCDRLGRRDARFYAWLPALAALLVLPCAAGFAFSASSAAALAWFAPLVAAMSFFFGPSVAMSQALVQPRMRAFTSATYQFTCNAIGSTGGPLLVGLLNDRLARRLGPDAIRTSLVAVSLVDLGAIALYLRAARTLRADLAANREAIGNAPAGRHER